MRFFKLISLNIAVATMVTACGSSGDFSKVLDPGSASLSTAAVVCKISTVLPNTATLKINAQGGSQNFVVGGADSACTIVWKLNGTTLAGASVAQAITSAQLNSGVVNTLEVTVSNATTSDTHSWGISKNNAPICPVKNPATNPATFAYSTPQALFGLGTDPDGDTLSNFTWKYDDVATPALFTSVSNTANTGSATFTSVASGTHKVSLTFSDGFDTGECAWTMDMTGGCSLSAPSPSTATNKMASAGATQTYSVSINNVSCIPTWTLNAAPLTGTTGLQTITSSQLAMASNILTVVITNGTSTDSKSWTILRNNPPTCNSKTPASNPASFTYGTSQNFSGTGTDSDGDTLTGFTWKFNDAVNGPLFTGISTTAPSSSSTFTPTSSQVGSAQKVSLVFSDGYDTGECAWTMPIITQCSVASSFPAGATSKLASGGASSVGITSQNFTVVPNDSGCNVTWTLNGSAVGTTSANQLITSGMLNNGASNVLIATLSNGTSSATRTWNITRNQIPTCGSKSPATNPAAFVYTNNTKVFSGTPSDPDGDAITSFTWKFNDNATPTGLYTNLTPASPTTTQAMTFVPTSSQIGTGQKLSVVFSDGYDTGECYWNFDVANTCSLTSTSPSTATYKVANSAVATQSYVIVPNDSGCVASWTLNGTPIAGTNTIQNIAGSSLNPGNGNTLDVQISNGVSTANRSWTITRNQIPICASKTPVAAPTPFAYNVNTVAFVGNASDPDGDTLSGYTWKFNDNATPTAIYTSVSSTATSGSMTFAPTASQVGTSQKVGLSFTDGYDTGECYWNFTLTDPNTISLVSCNPVTNPIVVTSTGAGSSKDLQINALNASSYSWTRGGSTISGATSSLWTALAASGAPGNYTYVASATDSIGSSPVQCTFNVKLNGPPTITGATPLATQSWRVNWGGSLALSVTATDPNSDTLSYTWTLDGTVQTSYLNSTTSSATFSPNFTQSLVDGNNPHTIQVTVSDGYESASQSWTVEVNKFSNECNTLFNGTVASQGGKICTLAGVPGIGGGLDPTADQSLIRLQTAKVIDDGNGNWWILDYLNNVVSFYNRSGSAIGSVGTPFFGIPGIPAGKMAVIIGNGVAGVTADNNFNTAAKINTGNNWGGITYDPAGPFVYVADWSNNRVLRIDGRTGVTNGKVTTVIGNIPGGTATTNNAAGNTDGNLGTTHYCTNPADVLIATTGGVKYLYVTCYTSASVKRMMADHTLGTYGQTYVVIGKTTQALSIGPENGTLGLSGDARTSNPWSLASDSSGNIYFSEGTNNGVNGGSRIRMINYGGSTATFFGGTTSPTNNSNNGATDSSGTPLTAVASTFNPTAPVTTATKATMWGNTPNVTSQCVELRIQAWVGAVPATLGSNITFTISNNVAASDLYSNSACSLQTGLGGTQPSRTITMPSGTSEMTLYFKNTTAGASTATLGLSSTLATNTGMTVYTNTVNAGGANTKLALVGPLVFDSTICQKLFVQVQNAASGISSNSLGSTRIIKMFHNSIGTYYSDASCTTPDYNVSIANGATGGVVYYQAKAEVAANQVNSILGGTNTGTNPVSTYPTAPTLANNGYANWGMTTFQQPRGLAVYESLGSVKGFFVSAYNNSHRIIYINNDSNPTLIGSNLASFTTPSYQAAVVAGTGTGAFNSDGYGVATRLWNQIGISMMADNSGLIISDSANYRVRVLDLTGTGGNAYQLTTYLGVGRGRSGNLGDSPVAANGMYFNTPGGLVVDNTNRLLYSTDSSNGRIRRTNLLTGQVDTIIGNGVGAGSTDGIDPTTVQSQSPRGLTMVNRSGTNFLVYSDQQSNTGVNQSCQIRALNLTSTNGSPPPTNFYTGNTAIGAYKVSTIAGDYGLGCNTLAGGGTSTPTNTKLYNPEGIASDSNGNIYAAIYNDHCIIKIAPDGTVTTLVGVNGVCTNVTAGIADGSDTTNAAIYYPMAVAVDPRYSAYGNFFFADAYNQNPSRIRYVNYKPTAVQVGSVSVPGATAPNGVVMTIWTISPSSNSAGYVNGLTSVMTSDNKTHLCYAAGQINSGSSGAHNVQCYDIDNALGSPDLRVGPDHVPTSSVRGGTTVDSSQEGIASGSALLYAPYGITFDSSGNLYISERSAHQIRMVRRWW